MTIGQWDLDASGRVLAFPLVAFETFVPHGVLCGLKIHYIREPQQLVAGEAVSTQLVLTPEMARQIAAALISAAQEAETGPGGQGSN